MSNTQDILRSLVPKCCKMVDGRLKGGFVDWESKEGKAVNEGLLAIALIEELKELGFCSNYQQERADLVEWIDTVNQIIKDSQKVGADVIVNLPTYKVGWIPFDDPMCDSGNIPNKEVLVCKEDGTMDFDIFDFTNGDWKFNSKHHKNKAIAWMPLPEAYQPKGGE